MRPVARGLREAERQVPTVSWSRPLTQTHLTPLGSPANVTLVTSGAGLKPARPRPGRAPVSMDLTSGAGSCSLVLLGSLALSPSRQIVAAGDQTSSALIGQIRPRPLD